MILSLLNRISEKGVMGINRRNADYTLMYNSRRSYPLVDDKLLTKQRAMKAGISVPQLYGVVEINHQIRAVHDMLSKQDEFVVKPAQGSGGDGIIVISGRSKKSYRLVQGTLIGFEDLDYHISNILSGIYSLGGQPDKALIEYRVQFDPLFEKISYLGVPDIRIIIFLGVPVMAMVRLPTRMSKGKANLHQGAIGAGIDITSGTTLSAVWQNEIITEHPDTGNTVTGLHIPGWDDLLHLASQCYELTGLGYQGVDIVLDKTQGPLILEINARPGLNIQIANQAGLLPRLRLVKQEHENIGSITDRVAFAREHFSSHGMEKQ